MSGNIAPSHFLTFFEIMCKVSGIFENTLTFFFDLTFSPKKLPFVSVNKIVPKCPLTWLSGIAYYQNCCGLNPTWGLTVRCMVEIAEWAVRTPPPPEANTTSKSGSNLIVCSSAVDEQTAAYNNAFYEPCFRDNLNDKQPFYGRKQIYKSDK